MSKHGPEVIGTIGAGGNFASTIPRIVPQGSDLIGFDLDEHAPLPKGMEHASLLQVVTESDLLIVSIPYPFGDTLDYLSNNLPEESTAIFIPSVQIGPERDLRRSGLYYRDNIALCHPQFGEKTVRKHHWSALKGQKFTVTHEKGERAGLFFEHWEDLGSRPAIRMTSVEHDRYMAPHFMSHFVGRIATEMVAEGLLPEFRKDAPTPSAVSFLDFIKSTKGSEALRKTIFSNPFGLHLMFTFDLFAMSLTRRAATMGNSSKKFDPKEVAVVMEGLNDMLAHIFTSRFELADQIESGSENSYFGIDESTIVKDMVAMAVDIGLPRDPMEKLYANILDDDALVNASYHD